MNIVNYLRTKKYMQPSPEKYYDEESGVLDLCWNATDNIWAVLEVGENSDSDFSFCAQGFGGKIKMQGAATVENIEVVIDFAAMLMRS